MQALKRTAGILDCFVIKESTLLSLKEIIKCTNVPKPIVHRICETLIKFSLIKKLEQSVQFEIRTLGTGKRCSPHTRNKNKVMEKLQNITGESIHLSIPDGTHVPFIEALGSSQPLKTKI